MRDGSLKYSKVEGAMHDFSEAVKHDPVLAKEWHAALKPMKPVEEARGISARLRSTRAPAALASGGGLSNSKNVTRVSPGVAQEQAEKYSTRSGRVRESTAYVGTAVTYGAFMDDYGGHVFNVQALLASTKITVGPAIKSKDKEEWVKAMANEMRLWTRTSLSECRYQILRTTLREH